MENTFQRFSCVSLFKPPWFLWGGRVVFSLKTIFDAGWYEKVVPKFEALKQFFFIHLFKLSFLLSSSLSLQSNYRPGAERQEKKKTQIAHYN